MEINSTQPVSTSPSPSASGTGSATAISSDFETFLQMLTAQARYQDPLEPIDSSEYAAQLAQFSMVEQQVLSNDLLTALSDQLGTGSIAQMAGWIGMEARTSSPVRFDGTPLTVVPRADPGADEQVLVVYDATGTEVQREQISTSGEIIEWAGVAADGNPLPEGNYRFATESFAAGELTNTTDAEAYGRISETRREGNAAVLILDGGSTVSPDAVSGLRAASPEI